MVMALASAARAQCSEPSKLTGYNVRSVKVEGFSGNEPEGLKKRLDSFKGQSFSEAAADLYLIEVDKEVGLLNMTDPAEERYLKLFNDRIISSINSVRPFWCAAPAAESECKAAFPNGPSGPVTKCVDVTIKRGHMQMDMISIGSIVVPVYRPGLVALAKMMPGPLMAINPEPSIEHDRKLGTAAGLRVSTDLLALGQIIASGTAEKPDASQDRRTHLLLDARGQKSIDEPFYKAHITLALSSAAPSKRIENLAVETNFLAKNLPRGNGKLFRNAVEVGANMNLKLGAGPLQHLSLGGNYRWSSNRFFSDGGLPPERASENAFAIHAISDGRINNGYMRVALWADHGSPKRSLGSYNRLAAALGIEKEFVIPYKEKCRITQIAIKVGDEIKQVDTCVFPGRNEQTIGVEAIVGAGRAWNNVPEYARFYGGNTSIDFLHDNSGSQGLASFPTGPILRSAGHEQAAVPTIGGVSRGATSYWNLNLNVSIPIPSLSRALIPAVLVEKKRDANGKIDSCDKCTSLKQVVKDQVAGGINPYISYLAKQKLTPDQVQAIEELDEDDPKYKEVDRVFQQKKVEVRPEAEEVWKEITPPVKFIADYANLYSIKPLIMFDAARLGAPGSLNDQTRYALGGGVQLTIIVVKFEAGYLRTIHRIAGDNRGNFVARLSFKNIF
jgi:hypothetical protein